MGITKHGAFYKVVARIRDATGKTVQRQKLLECTKEEAKSLLEKFKQEIRGGNKPCSLTAPKTFGEILQIYRDKRQTFSRQDVSRYNELKNTLGNVTVSEFPDKFEKWLNLIKITKRKRMPYKPLSGASINRFLEIVRASFNVALALELIEKNPITKVRFPKYKEVPRDIMLSQNDRFNLLDVIRREAPHLSAIVRFALQVPCRKSELVNMRVNDLDMINNKIRIRNGTTKNGEGIWKPIPPDMVDYFRSIPRESQYLFFRVVDGKYFPLGDFKRAWRRCLRIAELDYIHFHDTRHISATDLVDNGTPERVVMTIAGWKTNMLKDYYKRDSNKALELVRFEPNCANIAQTPKVVAL